VRRPRSSRVTPNVSDEEDEDDSASAISIRTSASVLYASSASILYPLSASVLPLHALYAPRADRSRAEVQERNPEVQVRIPAPRGATGPAPAPGGGVATGATRGLDGGGGFKTAPVHPASLGYGGRRNRSSSVLSGIGTTIAECPSEDDADFHEWDS
jgi:hypothetical protein